MQRADIRQGTSGATASVVVFDRASSAGATQFDGTFDSTVDWAAAAVEIRPGGAAAKAPAAGPDAEQLFATPLDRVFPNPATQWASISYELRTPATPELIVYNARGQRVRTLRSGSQVPGRHLLQWDTRDGRGVPVPAGIYFVRLELGERTLKQKFVVQR